MIRVDANRVDANRRGAGHAAIPAQATYPDGPDAPAGDVLRSYLATQSAAFLGQLAGLRTGQPESSHRIRVACRRARSTLRTFRPLLDAAWADRLAADIAEFTDAIGPERDLEVVRDQLTGLLNSLDTQDSSRSSGGPNWPAPRIRRAKHGAEADLDGARTLLDRWIRRELATAREATLAALAGPKFHALADAFALAPQSLPFAGGVDPDRPAYQILYPLVGKSFATMERRAAQLPHPPDRSGRTAAAVGLDTPGSVAKAEAEAVRRVAGTDPEAAMLWHRVRIAAKRCRYAAEVCVPATGPDAARFAGRIAELTEGLGAQQDAIVASALLLRAAHAPRITAPTGLVLGRLLGECRVAVLRSRLEFPAAWERVADPGLRSWLDRG